MLGELDGFVHGEIQTAVADVLLNPSGKFPTFVSPGVTLWTRHTAVTKTANTYLSGVTLTETSRLVFQSDQTNMSVEQVEAKHFLEKVKIRTHLVSKYHESIVSFPSDGSAHTLGSMPHGIERQEIILPDLEVIPEVLQTSLSVHQERIQGGG